MKSSLSKAQSKALHKLLSRKVPPDQVITPDLASQLAELALELQNAVSILIDRNGKVRQYYFGDLRQIKEIKAQAAREGVSRLAQLRLITANPIQKEIGEIERLLLKRYNLDLLLFIHASTDTSFSRGRGYHLEHAAYGQLSCLSAQEPFWRVQERQAVYEIADLDLPELLLSIEEELASTPEGVRTKLQEAAILVGLGSEDSFAELHGLTNTAGAEVVYQLKQNVRQPDPKYFIGSGKIRELELLVEKYAADLVIFDAELSPSQARNIEREIGEKVKVLDRTELILDIFAQRAKSQEGKLQVELAQLKYLSPRLVGGYKALSKLGGGIGTRGPGETKLEVERRRLRERIGYLERKVQEIGKNRSIQRRNRKRGGLPTVSLLGYTNAGKSTLFRAITATEVLVEDKLFATLDPTVRKVTVSSPPLSFLLSDTVGFIQNLPTTLIDAFRATLEEIGESDLLLVVLDTSHPNRLEHLCVVRGIIAELGLQDYRQLLLFNKIDLVPEGELGALCQSYPGAICLSSLRQEGFSELFTGISEKLKGAFAAEASVAVQQSTQSTESTVQD